jgi:hypothetical protein
VSLHDVFTVLCVIAYIVFVALAIYTVKKKNSLPMLVALVISSFFNLMVSLTAK